MTKRVWTRLLALSAAVAAPALAFDTQTHAYLTYQAYLYSNLGNSKAAALLQQLGLDRFDPPQPFSPYWLSVPAFAGLSVLAQGTIRFDSDPTLLACPARPTGAPVTADSASLLDYLDTLEAARDLGVSGEQEPGLVQYR